MELQNKRIRRDPIMNRETIKAWYQASRPPFFVATMIPLILGGVLAGVDGHWDTMRWVVMLLASFFVHLNTNLANDYFDHFAGVDDGDSIGGSRVIQEGKITPKQIGWAMVILYGLSLCCGLWLLWETRLLILIPIMLFSFFSSLFYTAPPFRYGYYGLGELFVGVNMGPVMVGGTYAVLTGSFSLESILCSIPIALMVAMILFYQSLPDMDIDRSVGKKTIAVRAGKKRSKIIMIFFLAASVLSIMVLVQFKIVHPVAALSLFTTILAMRIVRMIETTPNWVDLHGRGGVVRAFYMVNGLMLITSAIL
jgi:1,4-dihydroxy-2-naphthoate polyprenyltransferase